MSQFAARRRAARVCIGVLVVVLVAGLAGYPVYVAPRPGTPEPADAIVVLGGPGLGRYEYGVELADRGLAKDLVFSDPHRADRSMKSLCEHGSDSTQYTVTCFTPDPATTKGEIAEINQLAAARGWKSIMVVTFTPHVARTRYLFDRCYYGHASVLASPDRVGIGQIAWQYVYQTVGFARSFVQRGC
ncbi:YdcF family protein [Gordonia lacunae]|uniref:YdcF family protein n=1 Tax=Gordonia lacunae TaxID=417102 RepID=UPI0039E53354